MSKLDAVVEKCVKQAKDINARVSEDLIRNIAKSLGPSVYKLDAQKVAGSNQKELDTIKKNFLAKKLGITDEKIADKAIVDTVEKMGKSNRNKLRVVFYALLVKKFKKEDLYS